MFRRACIFAFIVAALAAACAGPRGAVPSVAPASSARSHAGTSTLTVTLSIVAPALGGKRLKIFAYPLTWQGPAATPPPASLVLDANVSSGSKRCASGSGAARTCTLSAQTPMGNDAIVAFLLAGNRVVARGFVQTAVTGPATLDLDAGNVAVSSLTISAPLALKKRVFSVGVTPLAADGASVMLGRGRSIAVSVYGPTRVVPSPQATVGAKAATATFAFRGRSFVNPITVAAVIGTMSNTARIFPNRKVPHACAPLSDTNVYEMAQPSIPSSFGMQAAVAGSDPVGVALDTGSTSFAIAQAKLTGAQTSQLVGPGQYAQQTYEPSGTTIKGNYYLAPVTVYEPSADGSEKIGTTVPMEVLVTTQACAKNQPCVTDTSTAYMGVGFGRPTPDPSTAPGLMNGPLENAFLQLRSIVQGKMHPGFELTANSLTIGVNSATMSGVPTVQLSPFPYRPGDWDGPSACVGFNGFGSYQCGRMLLDIGIDSMFVNASTPSPLTSIQVVSPQQSAPVLSYSFAYPVTAGATPPAPNPSASPPIIFLAPSPPAFVNTGRNALAAANYFYDAGCGTVGFGSPAPSP